jgi:CDP-glucose 4,6-dehydratase
LALTGLAGRIHYVNGDVRDVELLKTSFERFAIDTVFHLAAQPIVPVSNVCPYETLSINVLGTYAVLEAVRNSSCAQNLIFASSGAFYGATTQHEPIREESPSVVAPNIYAPSKVAGDIAVRCYAKTYGIRAAVCRFINTYGPGNINFSTIVPTAIANIIMDRPFDFGARDDGSSTFDYLNIHDMTRGYLAVAEHMEVAAGEAFNFGGGYPISVRDLVQLISRLYDGQEREPQFHGPKKVPPTFKRLDTTKARRVLGWRTSISLEDGLRETIAWYKRFWTKL